MAAFKNTGADKWLPEHAHKFINQKRDKPFLLVTSFTSVHDICELCRGQKLPSDPIGEFPTPENRPPVPKNLGKTHDETDTFHILRESYSNTKMTSIANLTFNKWRQMLGATIALSKEQTSILVKSQTSLNNRGNWRTHKSYLPPFTETVRSPWVSQKNSLLRRSQ